MTDITFQKLNAMHFYAWNKGLKTGMYYLRGKSAVDAVKFTAVKSAVEKPEIKEVSSDDFRAMIEKGRKSYENGEDCEACGS